MFWKLIKKESFLETDPKSIPSQPKRGARTFWAGLFFWNVQQRLHFMRIVIFGSMLHFLTTTQLRVFHAKVPPMSFIWTAAIVIIHLFSFFSNVFLFLFLFVFKKLWRIYVLIRKWFCRRWYIEKTVFSENQQKPWKAITAATKKIQLRQCLKDRRVPLHYQCAWYRDWQRFDPRLTNERAENQKKILAFSQLHLPPLLSKLTSSSPLLG